MSTIKTSSISFISFHKLAIVFLWLVLVILSIVITPTLTQNAAAYGADNEADCVALGGTWEAPNASNYGRGGCSGKGPCEASGGIWSGTERVCVTVGKTYLNDSMENKIKAFNYYVALTSDQCNFGGSITGADIGNYVWLLGSNPHLAQGSRGSLDCNQRDGKDGKWLRDAMSLFNIPGNTAGEKLCALGMTQTSVSNESLRASCGKNASIGSDKFEWKGVDSKRSSVLSTIRKWYFNNQEPIFTDAMTYHVALQDFFNSQLCSATTTPQASYGDDTSSSKSFSIFVLVDGDVTPKQYTVSGDNQYKVSELYNIPALGGGRYVVGNVPCADYQGGGNLGGDLPTVGSILSQRKYADAYKTYILNNAQDTSTITDPGAIATPVDPDATTSCAIEGVGWIICPVLNFLSNITDAIYKLVSGWLTVDVKLLDANSGTANGWRAMRDIANVGFAVIFLIVIYSQLTGAGISNYGVKKILPRLVVMAIAINISFFITQLMVDISNILGSSIKDFFGSQAVFGNTADGFLANGNTFTDVVTKLLSGVGVAGVAAVGAAGAIAYGGIGLFIMVILAAIVAVAVTLLILAARQALIVILIVISPLAFLAMILPNTKKWYDKWQKIFISLLVIYPMIAIVFGASEMAANILVQDNVILGLAVATIPLFAVIPMLKGSLNAVPIAGNLASKFANRASLGGNVKNRAKQARGNFANSMRSKALGVEGDGRMQRATRWLAGSRARGAARDRRFAAENNLAEAAYSASSIVNNPNSSVSESAAAQAALNKMQEEEIANVVILESRNGGIYSTDELLKRVTSATTSKIEKIAAVRQIEARGGMGAKMKLAELTSELQGPEHAEVRQAIVGVNAKITDSNPSFSGAALPAMQAGTFNAEAAHVEYAKSNAFSANSFLNMHPKAQEAFIEAVRTSSDVAAKDALAKIQTQISSTPELAARADATLAARVNRAVTENRQAVSGTQPAPGAAPSPQGTADGGVPIRDAGNSDEGRLF